MIIVQYKLGGFYEREGGELMIHVFGDLTELKEVLENKYSVFLYNVNDLRVYTQTSSKVGGELDHDLTDEVLELMIDQK